MRAAAAWRARSPMIVVAAGAFAAVTAALWPAARSIAGNWVEIHDYQHGFLIAPIAVGWLIALGYLRRREPWRFSPTGLALLAGTLMAWVVALRAHSDIAMEALYPVVLWLTILAFVGWGFARHAAAPVAYLYFAIPVWEFLLPTLQGLSVGVTEAALGVAGIPAEVSEYFVTLPAGSFEIVEGCSGKRYLIVALAVSVIAGVLRQLHGWRLVALVVAAGVLALFANWIRIFVVIAAGHATDMQHHLVAVEHETFGNVIFVVLLVAIYLSSALVASRSRRRAAAAGAATEAARPGAGPHPVAFSPCILLAATAVMVHMSWRNTGVPPRVLGPLPVAAGTWQGPMPPLPAWSPRFLGTDSEVRASYRSGSGEVVQLYLNLYESQLPGKELVYYANTLLGPGAWTRGWPVETGKLEAGPAPALAVLEAEAPTGQRWLLAYVYKVGRWTTWRAPAAQAGYGLRSLARPVPSGVVAMTVQCAENCQKAQALVRVFWQDMSTSLLGMIPDDAA